MKLYVIGSGPAGVSCAAALLDRGYSVTLLDVGIALENDRQATLDFIQKNNDIKLAEQLKHILDAKNPVKRVYNSDFYFSESREYFLQKTDGSVDCFSSFAKGGLSNAWGAFVEIYSEKNFHDWPIQLADLTPHYQKIMHFLNPATAFDPAVNATNFYIPSNQAKKVLSHFEKNKNALNTANIYFHQSKIAANFSSCRYCGLCQHGCPYELIYSSAHTLIELQKNPRFQYIDNTIVDSFEETEHDIVIHTTHRLTKQKIAYSASQVFCGTGSIISTTLFLKSLRAFNQKITLSDSSHFMIPCIMKRGSHDVTKEKLHTLSQLFLKLPEHAAHLQIYTYMDHYEQQFKSMFGKFYFLFSPLIKPFLNRFLVIQGFLDSSVSNQFNLAASEAGTTELSAKHTPLVHSRIKKIISHLKSCSRNLGFYPLSPLLKISPIGKSVHFGASLPMRQSPGNNETDLFGRPTQFKRLHFVDASVFPSIPAGSITPTIMANAYRIGMECDIL